MIPKNLLLAINALVLGFTVFNPVYANEVCIDEKVIEAQFQQISEEFVLSPTILDETNKAPLNTEIACPSATSSANEIIGRPNDNLLNLIKNIAYDSGSILVAPAGWSKTDWLKASAVIAGIVLLSMDDDDIRQFAQEHRNKVTDAIAFPLEKLGNTGVMVPVLGLTYAASLINKSEKLQNVSLTALESAAIASILTTAVKMTVHRHRPNTAEHQYQFDGPRLSFKNLSFASGHTGTAFSIATVFAEAYKDRKLAPLLAYSAATLVGLSRIHDNKHWASDVLGGAVLGYLSGKFVTARRLKGTKPKTDEDSKPKLLFGCGSGIGATITIPIKGR